MFDPPWLEDRRMGPKMIIRTNLRSPDIFIEESLPLQSALENLLTEILDPSSDHFISSEYFMLRLIECTGRLNLTSVDSSTPLCPLIFDSWSCFNASRPGEDQYENCPDLSDLGFQPQRKAAKHCDQNGTWWIHPETNR